MSLLAHYADLESAAVVITGGGSGIGAALVEGFAGQGARVAFLDIAEGASEALRDAVHARTGVAPLFLKCDLTNIEMLRAAIARAEATHGAARVLINNAAFDERHEIENVTLDYWESNQAINLRPHFFTAQAVTPGMKAMRRGSIINFTSTSFLINHPEMPSYTAAKAGIVGLTKGLAGRLGAWGIRVNAIAPGWVMTERQKTLWATGERLAAHVERQCLKEAMQPVDVVGPCLFLASDVSRMLTAQTLIVDGGYL